MKEKSLVIVESPTKAKTIGKMLGRKFSVVSSMGHLIDLPKSKIGVDIEGGFIPQYVVIFGRKKVMTALKKESKGINNIYIATDPDREGEAIGWHIKERLFQDKKVFRVIFHEITPTAIEEAFKHPRDFDLKMIEAQAGRRILDRVVGYLLSPFLWKKIARGLSAGRVQSVALKLIVEREKQIQSFIPQEYWEVEAELEKVHSPQSTVHSSFVARLEKIEEKKVEVKNKEEADRILANINGKQFVVAEVKNTEKRRFAQAPFITSTMQQEAFNKLRFNAAKTMMIAQQLYEGIDLGNRGIVGLITYMRTDSTNVSADAIKEVRNLILSKFGDKYLPEAPNVYKVKKFAQEAHEAIRPTLLDSPAESLKEFLTPDQHKLYDLIYNRFVASQMTPALYSATTVDILAGQYLFTASGTTMIFDGYTAAFNKEIKESDENPPEKEKKNILPPLEKGEALDLVKFLPSQHFTKPPARYSDSSLVKALEEEGIGRPSTYAPIISTLLYRDYVRRIQGYFHASELGFRVYDLLAEYFPKILDLKFTAFMEEALDKIEEGLVDKVSVLQEFYAPFKSSLDFAEAHVQKTVITTDQICDKCGKPLVVKWGRRGKFLSCSGFPECKNSKSITSGVKCPEPGCTGELIERRSTRGFFFGCSTFPKCHFTSKSLPEVK